MGARTVWFCLIAAILMALAVLIPPERYSGPGDVFVPENKQFGETLAKFNVTSLWDCTPKASMLVACKVENEEESKGTLSFFEAYPHDHIVLYKGEGGSFRVLTVEGSAFENSLPVTCSVAGKKNTSITGTERVRVVKVLSAYRELEGVLTDPEEKGFIHNKTLELKRSIMEEKLCNLTLVTVEVEYPEPRSNVPFMVFLWSDVGVVGLVGIVLEKRRDRRLVFGALVVLSMLFLGTYLHDSWVQRNSTAGLSILERLNGSNITLQDSSNFGVLYVTVDGPKKAKALITVLKEFNVSVVVQKEGLNVLKLEGTLPLEELEAFRRVSMKVGSFHFHDESPFYKEFLERYRRENEIIEAHFEELSPGSRKTLEKVLEENEDAIENLNEAMHERAHLIIFVSTPSPSTPQAYHDLSAKLAFIGMFFVLGGLFTCLMDERRNR